MRSFFENLTWKLERFMQGRNGIDDLGRACCWGTIVMMLLSIFFGSLANLLAIASAGYAVFRAVSTNIPARQHENVLYLEKTEKIRSKMNGIGGLQGVRKDLSQRVMRFKSRKEYKYFKCGCGTMLRVKRGQGTRELVCPVCKAHMTRDTN